MPDHYGEGKRGGRKKLGEKSGMKKLSAPGRSVETMEARRTPSMEIPAPKSLPAPSMTVELPSTFAEDIAAVRRMTSTSRPRKSASAELARTSAPTSRASSAPRGPQVSMPMRSPAPRMSSMYTGRPTSAAPIRITATAPKKITPLPSAPRASAPTSRTPAPSAPARTSSAPARAATPRRSLPSPAGMSSPARKKQDEQISNLRSRVEQGRSTNFATLGSSFYSGLSRGK